MGRERNETIHSYVRHGEVMHGHVSLEGCGEVAVWRCDCGIVGGETRGAFPRSQAALAWAKHVMELHGDHDV